ncbi:hypothetical protein SLA2020_311850 [Shorea laevis]
MDITVSHAITPSAEWDEALLRHLLPRTVIEQILAIMISLFGQQMDEVFWNGSPDRTFSVKSAFCLLQQHRVSRIQHRRNWKWIWKLQCLEKIKLFVWLLWRGRVLTNSIRFERHFAATPVCPRYAQGVETPLHLLRDYCHSRLIWETSADLPNGFFTSDFEEWLSKNANETLSNGGLRQNWSTLFLSIIWVIWKSRNAVIFDNRRTPPQVLYQQASSLATDTRLALAANTLVHTSSPRWVRWFPPDFPFLKLNTDGALNHSSEQASAGGLIRDYGERWLHGFAINIGPQTSYMAELWGCRTGLQLASDLGISHLVLEMDSLLAVQMIQERRVGGGLASTLLSDIFHLLNSFTICKVQHTLREGNSAADFMASIGQNLIHGTTFYPNPPAGMESILHGDSIGTLFLRT